MTSRDNHNANTSNTGREKKTYDGRPVPEGYVLAPVWLKRDFVEEAPDILSENLTTRTYAGIGFLIGYVAVPPDKYEALKQYCDAEINRYLRSRRSGRCVIGRKKDGSPKLCPKSCRCTGCVHRGEYRRYNPVKAKAEIPLTDWTEEFGVEDWYPSFEDTETEEEKLKRLLEHLKKLDRRYYDIVTMKLAGVGMGEIFDRLGLKPSRGYQVVGDCETECRRFFGLKVRKRKKR